MEQSEKDIAEQTAQADDEERLRQEEEYRNRDSRPIGKRLDSAKKAKDRAHSRAERYAEQAAEAHVRAAQASVDVHIAEMWYKDTMVEAAQSPGLKMHDPEDVFALLQGVKKFMGVIENQWIRN